MPDIGCEEFELDVRLEKPKSRRKSSTSGRGIENRNFAPTTLNLASTTTDPVISSPASVTSAVVIPPINDLLSPLDASEITTFNQKHQSSSVDTLITPSDCDFIAITPQNFKSPANDYRSADCNELIMKELEILESRENAKRSALVSQSSVEVLPIKDDENGVENGDEYYGEVGLKTFLRHFLYFFDLKNFFGQF